MNLEEITQELKFPSIADSYGFANRRPMPFLIGNAAGGVEATTATAQPSRHASIASQDIEIIGIETQPGELGTISDAGWAQLPGSPLTSADNTLALWWKRYTDGDGLPTINDAGDHMCSYIHTVRGCRGSGSPFDVISTTTTAATTGPVAPAIQTISWNTLLLMFYGFGRDTASSNGNLNHGYIGTGPESTTISISRHHDRSTAAGLGGGYFTTQAPAVMPGIYTPGAATTLSFAYTIYTLAVR